MNISHFMQRVDGKDHFSQIEIRHVLRQMIFVLAYECKEVTTTVVIHQEILKCKISCYNQFDMDIDPPFYYVPVDYFFATSVPIGAHCCASK